MTARARSVVDWTLRALAGALLASMLVTALHDASQAWDVWYYHLPFAARLAGIVPRDVFAFDAANEARFAGFPLLMERAQGALWRITGRPESANLISLACVPLLAWLLRARYRVPWHATVLALLAIPLVHTHATAAYVDLPANTGLAIAVLVAIDAWILQAPPRAADVALAIAGAAVAANTKVMLEPLAALALVAIAIRARRFALPIALALPIVLATPIANLVAHGNPFYPVRTAIAGIAFPGPEEPYASSPRWLARAPSVVRFACSVLEIGARPLSDPARWTIDQWAPEDSPALRMGGFFGAYVLACVALVARLVAKDRSREARGCAIALALFTAIVACMPQSHELRYYLAWMIVLVAIALRLAARDLSPIGPRPFAIVAALAAGVVLAVTRGAYATPTGSTFPTLVRAHTDAAVVAAIRDGERVCVATPRWNLLWAAPFHPPKRYALQGAETKDECGGLRLLE